MAEADKNGLSDVKQIGIVVIEDTKYNLKNFEKAVRKEERFLTIREIFGSERDWQNSETYRKVLKHRDKCGKFGNEFCLECFGGGLTKFTENLRQEKYKKWCK